ncbi:hypothetical protein U3A58_10170 [Algoriphagus sp. C2-6-M1]|uniref:hypothetical protein n=1 Tax=Algoriphagus persicinus TaxID=3108754 RepID=UPI002B37FFBD|nr:hypothetical protein [Algoriphagus sp. C2-6-M1]MEB2780758.1 hypothetical protein [Algoriphagus sp. C2-6-M1]
MSDFFKRFLIVIAIPLALLGISPMLFPRILTLLPQCFKDIEYLNFVGNYSIAAGSFIGFILLTLAYLQQEKKHRQEIEENDLRKKEELIERVINSFENVKSKIKYRGFVGEPGIIDFHKNVKDYLIKHSGDLNEKSKVVESLQSAVKGSTFTKGGGLNLYRRSLDKVIKSLTDFPSADRIAYFEEVLLDEEKALIFYLYNFYFPKNLEFESLLKNKFLESLDPNFLAHPDHINWLKS